MPRPPPVLVGPVVPFLSSPNDFFLKPAINLPPGVGCYPSLSKKSPYGKEEFFIFLSVIYLSIIFCINRRFSTEAMILRVATATSGVTETEVAPFRTISSVNSG